MGSRSTINELLAGSVGGAAQVLVGQPLDTIKTRAQIAPSSVNCLKSLMYITHTTSFSEGMFVSLLFDVVYTYAGITTILKKGPMDILTQTLRKEGFLALYKGL